MKIPDRSFEKANIKLSKKDKKRLDKFFNKFWKEYGEVIKKLAKE